ncbi:MAG: 50S ribosomal protein L31 [Patescibacteria group bacterium]
MKKQVHPEYHAKAVIECACGNKITTGSTQKEAKIEICANCHPFFTGKKKIIDTAGRVEKFKARMASKKPVIKKAIAKKTAKKTTTKKNG